MSFMIDNTIIVIGKPPVGGMACNLEGLWQQMI
jgi:hypothetical protein